MHLFLLHDLPDEMGPEGVVFSVSLDYYVTKIKYACENGMNDPIVFNRNPYNKVVNIANVHFFFPFIGEYFFVTLGI